jgi:hypothetical protein
MVQRRGQSRFALEAEKTVSIRSDLRVKDLDGDVASETRVAGAINAAHPSLPDGPGDFVRPEV